MKYKTTITNVRGDNYYAHRVAKSSFPEGRFAFIRNNDILIVYSEKAPISTFTQEVDIFETVEYDINSLVAIPVRLFNMKINPTHPTKNGRRAYPRERVEAWVSDHFSKIGCSLLTLTITNESTDYFHKLKDSNEIVYHYYEVMGALKIDNPELFKEKFFNQMGQGKAFGYGLINLLN
jgi:hypothetical protein